MLIIDNDPQGSLAASLGYGEPDDISITLASIMTAVINEEEINPEYGILHHEEGVDLLPGNIDLSAMEMSIANVISREVILKEYIDMMREHYEIILIDCMPSLGMLTINALVAADTVIYDRKEKTTTWRKELTEEEKENYLSAIKQEVKNRYNFSAYMLRQDYYDVLKQCEIE